MRVVPSVDHAVSGTHMQQEIAKPQLLFKDQIDNSDSLFRPRLVTKPNAIKDLESSLKDAHPYEYEIFNLIYEPHQFSVLPGQDNAPAPSQTQFVWVDTTAELYHLLHDISQAYELAIDIEHHAERSYQGFSCILQISTYETDYIIDALALREHLHRLNDVFTNKTIVKVVHGADDTLWLQRDFGVYVVNIFNTQEGARELGLELSLDACVRHFFQVQLDKQFQTADWRQRPLPKEMMLYARQDTSYLLPLYHAMKRELLLRSTSAALPYITINNNKMVGALYRSMISNLRPYKKKVCPENPLTGDTNFKKGRGNRILDKEMEQIIKGVYFWRDDMARKCDESTGYIMSKSIVYDIGEKKACTTDAIRALYSPPPCVPASSISEIVTAITKVKQTSIGTVIGSAATAVPILSSNTSIAELTIKAKTALTVCYASIHAEPDFKPTASGVNSEARILLQLARAQKFFDEVIFHRNFEIVQKGS